MTRNRLALASVAIALLATEASAQITLVNMVPQARSGETNQDSEPSVAVNPANPLQIAGSAFTWDNLNGSAFSMLGNLAPLYVSTDGGATWSVVLSVPSTAGAQFPTGDINPRFTASPSGTTSMLYTGILHAPDFNMRVLRSADYRLAVAMTQIDLRTNNVDQPHLSALMSLFGDAGADHVYVGFNNGYGGVSPTGMTASLDWTLNGGAGAPTFILNAIETRSTGTLNQDGFSIVPTAHPDGIVYAGFYGWRSSGGGLIVNSDVVVVRDDNNGSGGFAALLGAGGFAGMQVVTAQPMQAGGSMGQNRLGASNMAISVDPSDSRRVYLVWGDQPALTTNQTLHVRLSTDSGMTWGSSGDLLTISNAVNPAIAVNSHGVAGLLYQQWGSNRWQAVFRRTNNPAGTTFDAGVVLANTDSTTPASVFQPYIGDYTGLVARGRDFYGVFSASNYPESTNFPTVAPTYQRYVNWGTHTLYADAAMTMPVSPSIDPFFFHSVELAPTSDFYVRDWTDSATSGDDGAEPSTHPAFYVTPDVWNRRGPTDGSPFVADPANEPAGNGAGNLGDNWAFARIRRNASATADTVTVHFAVSPFGTGSNYSDGTLMFPGLTMSGPDPTVSFLAVEAGPKTTTAYPWHLDAIASSHLCLGVQISTATDPYLAPGIVGHTPGWGTGTDLEILNDNNKAQRNMGLSSTPSHGGPSFGGVSQVALIHNAATFTRDMKIRYDVPREISERFGDSVALTVVGGEREPFKPGTTITLPNMRPGENRWIKVTLPASAIQEGEVLPVYFYDLKDGRVVSGFGIGIRGASKAQVIREALQNHSGAFARIAALYRSSAAKREAAAAAEAARSGSDERRFLVYLKSRSAFIDRALSDLERAAPARDPFSARRHFAELREAITKPDAMAAALVLTSLANVLDARITSLELAKGNTADSLQTLRWGRDVFSSARLANLPCVADLVRGSDDLERAFLLRKAGLGDYKRLLAAQSSCLASTGKALNLDLGNNLRAIRNAGTDYRALQKAHSDLLTLFAEAVGR